LIQFLSKDFIGRVFEIRTEVSQMLLLFIIVLLLDFTEFLLLRIEGTENKSSEFTIEEIKNGLWDNLTDLY
jgi:hypothetical protein